jgi:WD40 repeat protein
VWSVAYSPDGRHIISASDAETGTAVGKPLEGYTDYPQSVVYSPNGQHIISASTDSTTRIWDAKTGGAVGNPLKHTDDVRSIACSLDG